MSTHPRQNRQRGLSDLSPEPIALPEPETKKIDDLDLVRFGLEADLTTVVGLKEVEAARQAMTRLSTQLTERLHEARFQVTEYRDKLRVLTAKEYHGKHGSFKVSPDEPHRDFAKESHPVQYAAIVAKGKLGVDYEFVME